MQLLLTGGGTSIVDSLEWKLDARVRSSVNVNTAAPGANIDAVAMAAGNRVVLAGQTAPAENGIWVYNGAAVPMTRALDANTGAELVNAVLSIEEGTSAGQTWRQSTPTPINLGVTALAFVPFGSGDVVGPGASTDNAISVFSGATGKIIKNSLVVLSTIGALLAPAGTAALPAFSPLAAAGLYATGVANTIALSTNSVARLTIDTAAVTSTLPYVGPAGAVGATTFNFGTAGTGIFGDSTSLSISTGGVLNVAISTQTSGAGAGFAHTGGTRTGGAGVSQLGVTISYTLNQTSTAAFTALDIAITETAVGSGAQYLINAKTGAAGTTQVFAVTNVGAVLAGAGTQALPAHSFVGDPDTGILNSAANTIGFSTGGTRRAQIDVTGSFQLLQSGGLSQASPGFQTWLAGQITTTATPSLLLGNLNSTYAHLAFTGGAGILQLGVQISHTINQTSTAAFTALDIVRIETAVGSGAQYFINAKGGAGGATQVFAVTNHGGISNTTTTVTLGAGSTDNSTALGSYGVIEVTSNGAGSTLTGIVAPLDERYLLIRHIAGLTLTLTHQTVSTAANQFFNGSGATTIVLGIGGQAWYRYSLSAARWCLISYTL